MGLHLGPGQQEAQTVLVTGLPPTTVSLRLAPPETKSCTHTAPEGNHEERRTVLASALTICFINAVFSKSSVN